MLKVGEKAPDFSLAADDGTTVTLKSLYGKKVVLYFYPKDDTPGCTKEACSFTDHLQRFEDLGAMVIGVSADTTDSHQKFSRKYNLEVPLLSDPATEMLKRYGVWKEKNLYGKKTMGIERTTYIINRDGYISAVFPKVQVDGHTEEVLVKLEEMTAGGK